MLVNRLRIARRIREWLIGVEGAYLVYEDNQACIKMAEGDGVTKRAKHIDVRYHVTREASERGKITLEYISTEDQVADALTNWTGKVQQTCTDKDAWKRGRVMRGLGVQLDETDVGL
jgi:hypothetical protein